MFYIYLKELNSMSNLNWFKKININYLMNINKGVFYDETYEDVEDLVTYSHDIIDRNLKRSNFRFEYTINKVYQNSSFKLTKLCKSLFLKLILSKP